ncbi:alginate lyase family protein [Psychromonas sp. CNPT3]|uniref:alginate lyase family protein n=1 Tax=Psychromonas sp. CNPT3 TaxID=314282 RepID=UPI0018DBDAA5|nr:alginate lyase family protein [Psychromonas sp. CNPT3]
MQMYILKYFLLKYGFKISLKNFSPLLTFFYGSESKEKVKNFYDENPQIQKEVIKSADAVLMHQFYLLGSNLVTLSKKIPWNKDFKSNFVWENIFYKDIVLVDLNNSADVKIPWEVSRFQHFFCLGKAYWITGDAKYFTEMKFQTSDWIDSNPYCFSVNWTCAMDVGIRAVNWIHAYFHFEEPINQDKKFKDKFNQSLYQHGQFIFRNLENGEKLKNNHYLSNLVGLIYLGLYFCAFKENKEHEKWLCFSMKELEKEMFIQNHIDGSNYETSTSYHRLVTELFFFAMLLTEKNKINFTESFRMRLELMHEFLMNITKTNGTSPLIGDVDDGRLLIISDYYGWKKNALNNTLGLAGLYFKRKDFSQYGSAYKEECLWISGLVNYDQDRTLTNGKSISYPDGGLYFLKNKAIYCAIRCGALSLRGKGGHSHNDQLAIELNILGEDFFIDPGVDVYTADYKSRNKFRSTKMHNTVSIDGDEQNDFDEKSLFQMKEQSFAKCLKFNETEFEGEHYGFYKKNGVIHNRKINIKEGVFVLQDEIKGGVGIINFVLCPDVELYFISERIVFLRKNFVELQVHLLNGSYIVIKEDLISLSYGRPLKTKKIEINIKNRNKISFSFQYLS